MVSAIQRFLQFLVILGLVAIVARPSLVPEPASSVASNVHVWVMGQEDTWQSFQNTWKQRLEWIGNTIPWVKSIATTIPSDPPQITADGILNFFGKIILNNPREKFETIKQEALEAPVATSSSSQ